MDDNTAFVWLLGLLFVCVAVVRVVYWISWGVVNRAKEHTKHLQIEADERLARENPPQVVDPSLGTHTWPEHTVKRTWSDPGEQS